MSDRDEWRAWLVEESVDEMHSWRCRYEVYGPCLCMDDLTDALMVRLAGVRAQTLRDAADRADVRLPVGEQYVPLLWLRAEADRIEKEQER